MRKYEFESGDGTRLVGILSAPEDEVEGLVVACHGLLSDKGSDKYVELSERFARRGVSTFRFDFRGCGESEGIMGGPLLSDRIGDLDAAIDLMRREGYGGQIGLFGSSFGGVVAVVEAARVPSEVSRLATWAAPSRLDELFSNLSDMADEEETGLVNLDGLLPDMKGWKFPKMASKVSGALVVHGARDQVVPVDHADTLYSYLREPKRKMILENADHVVSNREDRDRAMEATVRWICEGLVKSRK